MSIHIRWAIRRDMPEILEIENLTTDQPWTEEEFLARLRERNCIGMVAEQGDYVVGFMIYSLLRKQIVITNFAVSPLCSRQGIGTSMMNKLKGKLSSQRRRGLSCVIRETNTAGALFLRKQGFQAELVPGHFDDRDGYSFGYEMSETPEIVEKYRQVFTS